MNRYEFIDIAKGIGILMVVWAHILLVGVSHSMIYAFHMPLFFFISGFLFNKEKYFSLVHFIKQRTKRLFVPYLWYSIVTWCIWACFRYFRNDDVDSYLMPLLQTFIAQGSGAYIVHNSALWFIPCLFAVEVLYFLFSKFNEWITLLLSFAIAIVGCILVQVYGDNYLFLLPWNLDAAFFALPFYSVANAVRRHVTLQKLVEVVSEYKIYSLCLTLVLWIILFLLSVNYSVCSMGSSSYNCPLGIFFIRAFIGCFAMILFSILFSVCLSKIRLCKVLKWFGRNSLDVMCLHIPIKGFVIIIVAYLLHVSIDVQENFLYSGISFVITIFIMAPIIWGINKYIRK